MRPLRYSINVTLDGCCDHRVGIPTAALHEHARRGIERADAIILGRPMYELMEGAWRAPSSAMPAWMLPFAQTMDRAKKYVASTTLASVDWNAELLRGDLVEAVRALKAQPGDGLALAGVKLPVALAAHGLIDEYIFVVHPRVAGHGPYLLAGLGALVDLALAGREDLGAGIVAMTYVPRRG